MEFAGWGFSFFVWLMVIGEMVNSYWEGERY